MMTQLYKRFETIYKGFFDNQEFSSEFLQLEDKKGYKRINKISSKSSSSGSEMREYIPIASDTRDKYNVYYDNVIVYDSNYIKKTMEKNANLEFPELLISNECLLFFDELYNNDIFFYPNLAKHVLKLFSLYEMHKSIRDCICMYLSNQDCHLFCKIYLLFLQMGGNKKSKYLNSKAIIAYTMETIINKNCLTFKECIIYAVNEIKIVESICKTKFTFDTCLQLIILEAKSELITTHPNQVSFKDVIKVMTQIIEKLGLQKHYVEMRDILREFYKNEAKTRFFLNFHLYDFVLFFLHYLNYSDNKDIEKLMYMMQDKLNVVFTHENLDVDPQYIFEWYFRTYCAIFEQTCENKKKIKFILQKNNTRKQIIKKCINVTIVKPKPREISASKKVFPFSPMFDRIREASCVKNNYKATRKLNFK